MVEVNKLSIIIPAYNEEKTIHSILGKIKEVVLINNIEKEIIIVNGTLYKHPLQSYRYIVYTF